MKWTASRHFIQMSVDKINDNAEAATKSDRRHHKTSLRMSTSYREGSGRFNNIFK